MMKKTHQNKNKIFPPELLLIIYQYSSIAGIFIFQRVCKKWREILDNDILWKQRLKIDFGINAFNKSFNKQKFIAPLIINFKRKPKPPQNKQNKMLCEQISFEQKYKKISINLANIIKYNGIAKTKTYCKQYGINENKMLATMLSLLRDNENIIKSIQNLKLLGNIAYEIAITLSDSDKVKFLINYIFLYDATSKEQNTFYKHIITPALYSTTSHEIRRKKIVKNIETSAISSKFKGLLAPLKLTTLKNANKIKAHFNEWGFKFDSAFANIIASSLLSVKLNLYDINYCLYRLHPETRKEVIKALFTKNNEKKLIPYFKIKKLTKNNICNVLDLYRLCGNNIPENYLQKTLQFLKNKTKIIGNIIEHKELEERIKLHCANLQITDVTTAIYKHVYNRGTLADLIKIVAQIGNHRNEIDYIKSIVEHDHLLLDTIVKNEEDLTSFIKFMRNYGIFCLEDKKITEYIKLFATKYADCCPNNDNKNIMLTLGLKHKCFHDLIVIWMWVNDLNSHSKTNTAHELNKTLAKLPQKDGKFILDRIIKRNQSGLVQILKDSKIENIISLLNDYKSVFNNKLTDELIYKLIISKNLYEDKNYNHHYIINASKYHGLHNLKTMLNFINIRQLKIQNIKELHENIKLKLLKNLSNVAQEMANDVKISLEIMRQQEDFNLSQKMNIHFKNKNLVYVLIYEEQNIWDKWKLFRYINTKQHHKIETYKIKKLQHIDNKSYNEVNTNKYKQKIIQSIKKYEAIICDTGILADFMREYLKCINYDSSISYDLINTFLKKELHNWARIVINELKENAPKEKFNTITKSLFINNKKNVLNRYSSSFLGFVGIIDFAQHCITDLDDNTLYLLRKIIAKREFADADTLQLESLEYAIKKHKIFSIDKNKILDKCRKEYKNIYNKTFYLENFSDKSINKQFKKYCQTAFRKYLEQKNKSLSINKTPTAKQYFDINLLELIKNKFILNVGAFFKGSRQNDEYAIFNNIKFTNILYFDNFLRMFDVPMQIQYLTNYLEKKSNEIRLMLEFSHPQHVLNFLKRYEKLILEQRDTLAKKLHFENYEKYKKYNVLRNKLIKFTKSGIIEKTKDEKDKSILQGKHNLMQAKLDILQKKHQEAKHHYQQAYQCYEQAYKLYKKLEQNTEWSFNISYKIGLSAYKITKILRKFGKSMKKEDYKIFVADAELYLDDVISNYNNKNPDKKLLNDAKAKLAKLEKLKNITNQSKKQLSL